MDDVTDIICAKLARLSHLTCTTFLYLNRISVAQSGWLLWQLSYVVIALMFIVYVSKQQLTNSNQDVSGANTLLSGQE